MYNSRQRDSSMANTMAVRTTGKRFVCVAIFFTLLAPFTATTAKGTVIQRLEQGDHLNIAAIGTSLTATSFNPQNWFVQTGAWLSAKYPGQVTLSDRAVSGTASVNLPEFSRPYGGTWQLEQVLANDNPDAIFIEFAINDAYKQFNISPAQSANNLKTLIGRINAWAGDHSKTVDIVVQTMNNTGPSYASAENDVGPYYEAWRQEAAADNVLLIDHYPHWIDLYNSEADHATWKSYVTDDIHPNTAGITAVTLPEVQRALMSQVPEPSCLVLFGTMLLGLVVLAKYSASGKKVYVVDMFNKMTVADISSDGAHPNQAGYDKMGDAWFEAIQSVPEPSASVLLWTAAIGLLLCHWWISSQWRTTVGVEVTKSRGIIRRRVATVPATSERRFPRQSVRLGRDAPLCGAV